MADVSIMITAKDSYSDAINKMRNTTTAFRQDAGKLQQELTRLNNNKVQLKVDLEKAKNNLKDAKKAFAEYGEAIAGANLAAAQADYDNIAQNLKLVDNAAKQTAKDLRELNSTASKMEVASGSGSGGSGSGGGDIASFAKGMLINQVGGAISGLADSAISSMFDSRTGATVSAYLTGMTTGAAAGFMAGGPAGAAIGAAIGALTGAINDLSAKIGEEDDAFKSTVEDFYNDFKTEQAQTLSSGKGIAAGRETDLIAFKTLLGGDADEAERFQDALLEIGRTPPFSYSLASSVAKEMLGLGDSFDEVTDSINAYADAAQALGWDEGQVSSLVSTFNAMRASGNVTSVMLRSMSKMGFDPYQYLMDATGQSKDEVIAHIKDLSGDAVARILTEGLMNDERFKGAAAEAANSAYGLEQGVAAREADMQAAMGQGYNDERKKGLQDQIQFYDEYFDQMADAYEKMGAWEAKKENLHEEAIRNALTNLYEDPEFLKADATEQGRMLAEAKAKAEIEYKKTNEEQMQIEADKQILEDLREALQEDWYLFGYDMGLEFTKGIASVDNTYIMKKLLGPAYYLWGDLLSGKGITFEGIGEAYDKSTRPYGSAYGRNVIPYDNFPILAHQGETLLTAGQSRASHETPSVTLAGNYYIREDADITRVATELFNMLQSASESYTG